MCIKYHEVIIAYATYRNGEYTFDATEDVCAAIESGDLVVSFQFDEEMTPIAVILTDHADVWNLHIQIRLIFEFAMITGMRPEEYLALRWSDLDLSHGRVSVSRALIWNRKGGGYRFDEPKTAKSRRNVPIPDRLASQLRIHRNHQLEERLRLGPSYANLDLVFATEIGSPINFRNLSQRHFMPLLLSSGIARPGLTLYSLRHTCATLLMASGENPKVVADRLGHASVKLTLDTYSHVMPDMQQSASTRLAKMVYG